MRSRLIATSVAALALALVPAASGFPHQAERALRSFVQPDGGDSAYLTKPKRFSWVSDGVTGVASGVRWRHWDSSRAVGRGRTRFCVTMNGGCRRIRVTAIASQRRGGFSGPEGGRLFFYCRVILRGQFNGDGRVLTVPLPTPGAVPCSN